MKIYKKIQKVFSVILIFFWMMEGVYPVAYIKQERQDKLSPTSSFTAAAWSSFLDQDLIALLESTKGLAFSQQPDEIDKLLTGFSHRAGQHYIRITVRDPEDLSALRVALSLKNGKLKKQDSPLKKLLYETGGILFLDYANSDPKLVEEFNSLFDDTPRFEGKEVSDELLVVGVMNRRYFARYPVSFYSRYRKVIQKKLEVNDPLYDVISPPGDYEGYRINLHYSSQYEELLTGKYFFNLEGELQFGVSSFNNVGEIEVLPEAILIKAMKEGKSLLIENGPWEEKERFRHFVRQILIQGGVTVNGEFVEARPGFKLYRTKIDESRNITPGSEVTPNDNLPAIVVNLETADQLFSISRIDPETQNMIQFPGWIQSPGEKIILRVTEPLPDEIWHQIFHAPRPVQVQVVNPEWVPKEYRRIIQKNFDKKQEPRKKLSWEEGKRVKGVYFQADSLTVLRERLKSELEREVWVYPVTPETTLSDLTGSMEVQGSETSPVGHDFLIRYPEEGVLQALKEGKSVVLEGVDRNRSLFKLLEPALGTQAYWIVNGEKVSLDGYPGQLILTGSQNLSAGIWDANTVLMEPEETKKTIRLLMTRYFYGPAADKKLPYNEAVFSQILNRLFQLEILFQEMPVPIEEGAVPPQFQLGIEKLKILFEMPLLSEADLLEAFERVYLAPYANQAEVHSYMRVQLKKILGNYLTGKRLLKTVQKPRSIDWNKAEHLKQKGITPEEMRRHFWEWADTLSPDLLESAELPEFELDDKAPPKVLKNIQATLARHSGKELQPVLQALYQLSPKDDLKWSVDLSTSPATPEWKTQREETLFALRHYPFVFLKGQPGVGKSYISHDIAAELGFRRDEIFELVTGANAQESDVLSAHVYDENERRSKSVPKVIEQWARKGGLLVWDEANLVPENFLQFLSGMTAEEPFIWINGEKLPLTKRHKVIFTGNPETFEGRRFQQLIEEKVITVNFYPFTDAELKKLILEQNYLPGYFDDKDNLIDLVLELHRFFERIRPDLGFSLRDIQEFASRIREFTVKGSWNQEQVVLIGWNLYGGLFDLEDREAIKALILEKYGVDIEAGVDESLTYTYKVVDWNEELFRGIGWTGESLLMVKRVRDFLKVRQARIESLSKTDYLGKWAMLFEGASGLGKDVLTEKTLQMEGLEPGKDYYVWNASPHKIDDLQKLINTAAKEGKIVILSEMNLVSSSILEGMLNTLLTAQGDFKPGFAVIGTINSVDFQGREAFSSAFKNRMAYYRVYDYSQKGMMQIAKAIVGEEAWKESAEAVQQLVGTHLWIRDSVAGPHQKPTLREFVRSLKRIRQNEPVEEIIQSEYGPVYFQNLLYDVQRPPFDQLADYEPKEAVDWEIAYRKGAEALLGEEKSGRLSFVQKFKDGNPLPQELASRKIELGEKGTPGSWKPVLFGAAQHLFHFEIPAWKPSSDLKSLYLTLENYRILNSVKESGLTQELILYDPEKKLLEAIQTGEHTYVESLSDRELFKSTAVLMALGYFQEGSYEWMYLSEVLGKEDVLREISKTLPALRSYIQATVSKGIPVSQEEAIKAQYQAFLTLNEIKQAWKAVSPVKPKIKPVLSSRPKKEGRKKGLDAAARRAEIARQKEERRRTKIAELTAEIKSAEILLSRSFEQIPQSVSKALQRKINQWKVNSKKLNLKNDAQLQKIEKRLAGLVQLKDLNLRIERLADQAAFFKNREPIAVLLERVREKGGLKDQVEDLQSVEFKDYADVDIEEAATLRQKTDKLIEVMEIQAEREEEVRARREERALEMGDPFQASRGVGSGGQDLEHLLDLSVAEDLFGEGFFSEVKPSGIRYGRRQAYDLMYTGDYFKGGASVYFNASYFEPHVFDFVRLEVKSQVSAVGPVLEVIERKEKEYRPVAIESGTKKEWEKKGYTVFRGTVPVKINAGEYIRIPAVGVDQRFFDAELPEGVSLWVDSDDQYYVLSERSFDETVVLKFSVAVPNRYFAMSIPDHLQLDSARKRSAEKIHADAVRALNHIGISLEEKNVKKILFQLVDYFSRFSLDPIPEADRTGNVFLDTVLYQSGACAHRTWVFVVLAQALGLEARMVTNRDANGVPLHAFPEIKIPSKGAFAGGWLQIPDLGGAPVEVVGERIEFRAENKVMMTEGEVIQSQKRKPAKKRVVRYVPKETEERRPYFEQISRENAHRLKDLLRDLFYEALASEQERQPSENGSHFSVTRFIEDPSRPFLSVVPRISLFPKQVLLTGPFNDWNPLLEELIFFLLGQGVQISIYEGESVEPYSIETLTELKNRLKQSPSVEKEAVKRYIQRERSPVTTAQVDLKSLQLKTESLYLTQLFGLLVDGKSFVATEKEETGKKEEQEAPFAWLGKLALASQNVLRVEDAAIQDLATKPKEAVERKIFHSPEGNVTAVRTSGTLFHAYKKSGEKIEGYLNIDKNTEVVDVFVDEDEEKVYFLTRYEEPADNPLLILNTADFKYFSSSRNYKKKIILFDGEAMRAFDPEDSTFNIIQQTQFEGFYDLGPNNSRFQIRNGNLTVFYTEDNNALIFHHVSLEEFDKKATRQAFEGISLTFFGDIHAFEISPDEKYLSINRKGGTSVYFYDVEKLIKDITEGKKEVDSPSALFDSSEILEANSVEKIVYLPQSNQFQITYNRSFGGFGTGRMTSQAKSFTATWTAPTAQAERKPAEEEQEEREGWLESVADQGKVVPTGNILNEDTGTVVATSRNGLFAVVRQIDVAAEKVRHVLMDLRNHSIIKELKFEDLYSGASDSTLFVSDDGKYTGILDRDEKIIYVYTEGNAFAVPTMLRDFIETDGVNLISVDINEERHELVVLYADRNRDLFSISILVTKDDPRYLRVQDRNKIGTYGGDYDLKVLPRSQVGIAQYGNPLKPEMYAFSLENWGESVELPIVGRNVIYFMDENKVRIANINEESNELEFHEYIIESDPLKTVYNASRRVSLEAFNLKDIHLFQLDPTGNYLVVGSKKSPHLVFLDINKIFDRETAYQYTTQEFDTPPLTFHFLPGGRGYQVKTKKGTVYRMELPSKTQVKESDEPVEEIEAEEKGWLEQGLIEASQHELSLGAPRPARQYEKIVAVSKNGRYAVVMHERAVEDAAGQKKMNYVLMAYDLLKGEPTIPHLDVVIPGLFDLDTMKISISDDGKKWFYAGPDPEDQRRELVLTAYTPESKSTTKIDSNYSKIIDIDVNEEIEEVILLLKYRGLSETKFQSFLYRTTGPYLQFLEEKHDLASYSNLVAFQLIEGLDGALAHYTGTLGLASSLLGVEDQQEVFRERWLRKFKRTGPNNYISVRVNSGENRLYLKRYEKKGESDSIDSLVIVQEVSLVSFAKDPVDIVFDSTGSYAAIRQKDFSNIHILDLKKAFDLDNKGESVHVGDVLYKIEEKLDEPIQHFSFFPDKEGYILVTEAGVEYPVLFESDEETDKAAFKEEEREPDEKYILVEDDLGFVLSTSRNGRYAWIYKHIDENMVHYNLYDLANNEALTSTGETSGDEIFKYEFFVSDNEDLYGYYDPAMRQLYFLNQYDSEYIEFDNDDEVLGIDIDEQNNTFVVLLKNKETGKVSYETYLYSFGRMERKITILGPDSTPAPYEAGTEFKLFSKHKRVITMVKYNGKIQLNKFRKENITELEGGGVNDGDVYAYQSLLVLIYWNKEKQKLMFSIFNYDDGKDTFVLNEEWELPIPVTNKEDLELIKFSPDGDTAVVATSGKNINLVDIDEIFDGNIQGAVKKFPLDPELLDDDLVDFHFLPGKHGFRILTEKGTVYRFEKGSAQDIDIGAEAEETESEGVFGWLQSDAIISGKVVPEKRVLAGKEKQPGLKRVEILLDPDRKSLEPVSSNQQIYLSAEEVGYVEGHGEILLSIEDADGKAWNYNSQSETVEKPKVTDDGKVFAFLSEGKIIFPHRSPDNILEGFHQIEPLSGSEIIDFVLDPLGRYVIYLTKDRDTGRKMLWGKVLNRDAEGKILAGDPTVLKEMVFGPRARLMKTNDLRKNKLLDENPISLSGKGDLLLLNREQGWEALEIDLKTDPGKVFLAVTHISESKTLFPIPGSFVVGEYDHIKEHISFDAWQPDALEESPYSQVISLRSLPKNLKPRKIVVSPDGAFAAVLYEGDEEIFSLISLLNPKEDQPFLTESYESEISTVGFDPEGSSFVVYLTNGTHYVFTKAKVAGLEQPEVIAAEGESPKDVSPEMLLLARLLNSAVSPESALQAVRQAMAARGKETDLEKILLEMETKKLLSKSDLVSITRPVAPPRESGKTGSYSRKELEQKLTPISPLLGSAI